MFGQLARVNSKRDGALVLFTNYTIRLSAIIADVLFSISHTNSLHFYLTALVIAYHTTGHLLIAYNSIGHL